MPDSVEQDLDSVGSCWKKDTRSLEGRLEIRIRPLEKKQLEDGEGKLLVSFKGRLNPNIRIVSMVAISLTLYGGGCVFIVLIAQLLGSLVGAAGFHLSLCVWMVIVAAGLTPLTWMGTPKDFWPIAVGALISTVLACILVIVNCIMTGTQLEEKVFPTPTADGTFKGRCFLETFLSTLSVSLQPLDQSCLLLPELQHFQPFRQT